MWKLLFWATGVVVGLALPLAIWAQGKGGGKGKGAGASAAAGHSQAATESNKGGETRGIERATEVQTEHKGTTSGGLAKAPTKKKRKKTTTTTTTTTTTSHDKAKGKPAKQ